MNVILIRNTHTISTRGNTPKCDMCGKSDTNLHKPKYSKGRICTACIKSLSK